MAGTIDRDKHTPSLLRCFWKVDGHNSDTSYTRDGVPGQELHFYTWSDASLRELTQLLKDVVPTARKRMARLEFSLVYPDSEGRNKMRVIGSVRNYNRSAEDNRTLKELRYQVGDYLDIAIWSDDGAASRGGMYGAGFPRDRGPPMIGQRAFGGYSGSYGDRAREGAFSGPSRRMHALDR